MVPDETSDLPTTLPEASFLNPNRKVPSEARSLRGLFPVPVFAEFPSYSLSKNADGFLQNPFWLSYCNLRKLKRAGGFSGVRAVGQIGVFRKRRLPRLQTDGCKFHRGHVIVIKVRRLSWSDQSCFMENSVGKAEE